MNLKFRMGIRVYIPAVQTAGYMAGYRPPYYVVEMDNGAEAIMEPTEIYILH